MIIKKYLAKTEREAIELAKAELGSNAIVMNIKKVHPKGLSKLFVRSKVEVTAALDENITYDKKESEGKEKSEPKQYRPDIIIEEESEQDVTAIEQKLNNLQQMLEKQMNEKENKTEAEKKIEETNLEKKEETKDIDKSKACQELIYRKLVENEVDETIARDLVDEIVSSLPKDAALDYILASIYQKIILTLGQPHSIDDIIESKAKYVFFLGPTGVGKTTTIAKLASKIKLEKKLKVALITADTYRIAAVEQLKTYANILGVPLHVVYTPEELTTTMAELEDCDICLVDTAGRSHKNEEQIDDIKGLLTQVPKEQRCVYLVLNAGTKYRDLKEVSDVYSEISDYSMIFTKLDETSCEGVLLNMKDYTKKSLSYVTWGQNVPDDIGEIDAQKIAKKLLGGKS